MNWLGVLAVVAFIGVLIWSGPTTTQVNQNAIRVLEVDGFTDIKLTGYNWFACSKDDTFHTGFTAKKNGKTISGTVCAGWFYKQQTIRFE